MEVPRKMNINGVFCFCLAFIILLFVVDTSGFPHAELYVNPGRSLRKVSTEEGSPCKMENGTAGICKKLPECPPRVADVRAGRRTTEGKGRCGFESFIEIVCCPLSVSDKIGVRAADAACHEYENEVTSTSTDGLERTGTDNDGLVFHILGGTRAATGEFPYMAALGYVNSDGEIEDEIVYNCGGTLITSRFVLTAAHCVSNINNRVPVRVRVGSEDLKAIVADVQEIPVKRVIVHPKYKRSVNYNDIALIELSLPARMSNNVKPICLQTRALSNVDISDDTTFVVIGFGALEIGDTSTDKLMKTANLSLVPTDICGSSYKGFGRLPTGLDNNMICALDNNSTSRSDGCQGDSGGPLLMITGRAHSVIGVTSFGKTCAGPDPAIYMSVYSYLDWIEENVWSDQEEA